MSTSITVTIHAANYEDFKNQVCELAEQCNYSQTKMLNTQAKPRLNGHTLNDPADIPTLPQIDQTYPETDVQTLSEPEPQPQPQPQPTPQSEPIPEPEQKRRPGRPAKKKSEAQTAQAQTVTPVSKSENPFEESPFSEEATEKEYSSSNLEKLPDSSTSTVGAANVTLDDCKAALRKVMTVKTGKEGIEASTKILKFFKAAKVSEVSPQKYQNLIQMCDEALL